MAKLLGAIIAGGKARRFGRDKAAEAVGGMAMIDHVVAALAPQVDALVLCGRHWRDLPVLADRPGGAIGPLGGLNAALHHAFAHGYDGVLCVPVDVLPVPDDLADRLVGNSPAVFEQQHLIGYWPVALADALDAHLAADNDGSLRQWFARSHPLRIPDPPGLRNINRPEDLP